MENKRAVLVIVSILLVSLVLNKCNGQLSTEFYKNICPNVESLVRAAVTKKFQQTFVTAPATLRLFFHDCFVQGCDASVILASPENNAEKEHPDNLSLAGDGFDTVIKAKEAVDRDAQCQNKVSCADILALATRDVIALVGGPSYSVELGRRDGRISTSSSVNRNLPHPDFSLYKLNTMFSSHGLNQTDVIALSGAHTIGFSHCKHLSKRIYNFSTKKRIDPTLNSTYAFQLRQLCPKDVNSLVAIPMDPTSPQNFDNAYFLNLKQGKGLFTSDQALLGNKQSRATVDLFASNNSAFNQALVSAITKLGRVGVKTGNQGEIRHVCSAVN